MSMASSQAPSATQSRHTQLLMQFNEDIFKQNVLTDIECVVEGQIFKAHRALLVCFSPYLKKKLISSDGKPLANKVDSMYLICTMQPKFIAHLTFYTFFRISLEMLYYLFWNCGREYSWIQMFHRRFINISCKNCDCFLPLWIFKAWESNWK